MKREYSDIFNLCFPQFYMSFERFCSLIHTEKCVYFEHMEGGELLAFAIVEDFAIRLICVTPSHQLCGIGHKLIGEIEAHLKNQGYENAITGGVSSRLFIGAVSESWGFFEKQGYITDGGCDEMLLELKDFSKDSYLLHGHDVAEYGWYDGTIEDIQRAVAHVDENWVQYFTNPENIYVAQVDGKIASFCLVDINCQNYLTDKYGKVGMPGCVGTVPEFRNKGIALEMIANVTEHLKLQGMNISFIYFTGVAEWYKKIGYRTFLSEKFGVKNL